MKHLPIVAFLLILLAVMNGVATAQDDWLPPDVAGAATQARPRPITAFSDEEIIIDYYFDRLPQGHTGLVQVHTTDERALSQVQAIVFGRPVPFFAVEGEGFYGLIAVNMEQAPRDYPISFDVAFEDGEQRTVETTLKVSLGQFISQDVFIPEDRLYLVDAVMERNEFARIESVIANGIPEPLWRGPWVYPTQGRRASPFGVFRTFNESVPARHTGWDMNVPLGTPIQAMGAGRVAFAGQLDIRGNYVLIDHGGGVFSGYAHMSQVHVTRGQTVSQGQIIGVVGSTGRSSGPHMHWEIIVNGQWVDSYQFIEMWMPTTDIELVQNDG